MGTLGWVLLIYPIVPAIIFALFWHRTGKNGGIVPGAVDNLAACAVAVAMCRFLVKNQPTFQMTQKFRFVSFGSEELGCVGRGVTWRAT